MFHVAKLVDEQILVCVAEPGQVAHEQKQGQVRMISRRAIFIQIFSAKHVKVIKETKKKISFCFKLLLKMSIYEYK